MDRELKKYRFEIMHVGINTNNAEEARKAAERIGGLFGFPLRETKLSFFVNEQIEVMDSNAHGKNGHIAVGTADVQAAKEYLESKGAEFDESTESRDANGKLILIYMKNEIAGFAFHLVQKK